MAGKFYIECDDSFRVESDDKNEVIKMGRMQLKLLRAEILPKPR